MDNKKATNPIGAVLAGVAVGAAAVFLSKEKNRKKIKNTVESFKKEGEQKLNKLGDKMDKLEKKGRKKLVNQLDQTREKVEGK